MHNPHLTVIAEAGVNHNGRLDLALQLVDAAATAGADAVKFQTFSAAKLASAEAGMAEYQKRNLGGAGSQLEMLRRLELDRDEHAALLAHCRKRNITFLSSPFDMDSLVFLLDELSLPTIKIPSGEITNGPLLFAVGKSGRRAILSTGMADLDDICAALDLLAWGYLGRDTPHSLEAVNGARELPQARTVLRERVIILQCTTEYPAPFDSINLRVMKTLRDNFELPVGLSDHSEGIAVAIAAAALGAVIIEKHLTLDRSMAGPDHKASIEPAEFRQMVQGIRSVEQALGVVEKTPLPIEIANRAIARKSLVAARAIAAGALITEDDLTAMRPGSGLSPIQFWNVLGSRAPRDYRPGELIECPSVR